VDGFVQLFTDGVEPHDDFVCPGPGDDGPVNIVIAVKTAEEMDHAVYILFVVASFDEAFAGDGEIGIGFAQFQSGLMISHIHLHETLVPGIVGFVMGTGILQQLIQAIFLCLGPEPFAAYIGAYGGEGMDRKKQDKKLDGDQECHDPDCEIELFGNRRVSEPSENGTFHIKGIARQVGVVQNKEVSPNNKARTPGPALLVEAESGVLLISLLRRYVSVYKPSKNICFPRYMRNWL
jgi:hypothetical protein